MREFITAALLLLITPGPTNTLLASAAAIMGARRALPLIGAEMLGYALSILLIEGLVAPIVEASSYVGVGIRICCALYLALTAWRIWTTSSLDGNGSITWARVFFATLSNPKAMIFVFVILPPRSIGLVNLIQPYGLVLLYLIGLAGSVWILGGATIHAGTGHQGRLMVRRGSSMILALFSVLTFGSALM